MSMRARGELPDRDAPPAATRPRPRRAPDPAPVEHRCDCDVPRKLVKHDRCAVAVRRRPTLGHQCPWTGGV